MTGFTHHPVLAHVLTLSMSLCGRRVSPAPRGPVTPGGLAAGGLLGSGPSHFLVQAVKSSCLDPSSCWPVVMQSPGPSMSEASPWQAPMVATLLQGPGWLGHGAGGSSELMLLVWCVSLSAPTSCVDC